MELNPDKLRARFYALKGKLAALQAKTDPVRAERDKIAKRHAKEIEALDKKVKAAVAPQFDIEQEMAMIVRALNGKMGEDPSEGEQA